MLKKLIGNMKSSGAADTATKEFEKIYTIITLLNNRNEAFANKLHQIALKISVSLLRYVGYVRLDKAFYEAGYFCEKLKKTNWAYVFYQKFLDILDAIEDQDPEQLNNQSIEHTDIPSLEVIKLPERTCISAEKIQDVRNYVLQFVSSDHTNMSLDLRKCE